MPAEIFIDTGRLGSFVSTIQGLYFFSALFVLAVAAIMLCFCVVCCSHFMDCISETRRKERNEFARRAAAV